VQMPPLDDINEFKRVIIDKYPSLEDVWFVVDGLKLTLERPRHGRIQSCFYNGWTHDHYVTNVFVFAPNGQIIACSINNPDNVHDSQVAEQGGVYEKLEDQHQHTGGKGVVDSAFSRGRYPFLIKSCQTLPTNTTEVVMLINEGATALRQASEWGVRGMQGSFPRVKDRIMYEEYGERLLMLLTVVHSQSRSISRSCCCLTRRTNWHVITCGRRSMSSHSRLFFINIDNCSTRG
jgi:hypothetical protein